MELSCEIRSVTLAAMLKRVGAIGFVKAMLEAGVDGTISNRERINGAQTTTYMLVHYTLPPVSMPVDSRRRVRCGGRIYAAESPRGL